MIVLRRLRTWRWSRGVFALSFALALLGPTSASADEPSAEERIKAAILFKLTQFVEWPEAHDPGCAEGNFQVCVFASATAQAAIAELAGKRIGQRSLTIVAGIEHTKTDCCSLIYFSPSADSLEAVLAQGVLTVSDEEGFCERGGIVELVRKRNKLRFRINLEAAERAGLRLSSQLLKVADIVKGTS